MYITRPVHAAATDAVKHHLHEPTVSASEAAACHSGRLQPARRARLHTRAHGLVGMYWVSISRQQNSWSACAHSDDEGSISG